jgi:hypothetical protein
LAVPDTNPYLGQGHLLQGLKNNTLVSGKTAALKLFYSNKTATSAVRLVVSISGPRNYQKSVTWFRE